MQTFDQALMDLYSRELITYEEAIHQATNPDDFALKVRGIQSTEDLTWEASGGQRPPEGGSTRGGGPPPAQPAREAAGGPGSFSIDRFDRKK